MTKIKSVTTVQFSPGGNDILYSVLSIHPDAKDKWEYQYQTQLWMADAAGIKIPHQLTFNKDGAANPVWSPDGTQIAFVRPVDGKAQIFILPVEAGEAWQLTSEKNGANNPVWFPDGKSLLFSSGIPINELVNDSVYNPMHALPTWNYEKAGFNDNAFMLTNKAIPNPDGTIDEIRSYLTQNESDKKAKVLTKLNFQQEATTSNEITLNHLFSIVVNPGSKSLMLTSGFYSYANAQFIPGTSQILLQTDQNASIHPDRTLESEVYTLDYNSKQLRKILGREGMAYNQATISPNGKWIAYTAAQVAKVNIGKLYLMPFNGIESDSKLISHDRSINAIKFTKDERSMYLTSPSNGGVVLYKLDLGSNGPIPISSYDEGINAWDMSTDRLAFAKTSPANPSELFISTTAYTNIRQISNLNTPWLKDKSLSSPEKHSFKNDKGLPVEYWVMKPIGYQSGRKYPAILDIHGGPTAMWGPGENSMWHEFQYYCAKGYGVVYSNPRGSGGYGEAFMQANIKDWGTGPSSDVLKALDGAVGEGWIDTSKLAVTGGSYAGYLIGWIVGHDKRFKAACSQRGVYDLSTFFGEGNAWRLVPNYFGGYPWEPEAAKVLERESPISYVQNITTPYLMFHGENDLRTGVIQGEQMFRSLKVMNRPVEYVRHPGATHEITRSGNNRQRIDQMVRTFEFFERYIKH